MPEPQQINRQALYARAFRPTDKELFARETSDRAILAVTRAMKHATVASTLVDAFYGGEKASAELVKEMTGEVLTDLEALLPGDAEAMLEMEERKSVIAASDAMAGAMADYLYAYCHGEFQTGRLSAPNTADGLGAGVAGLRVRYLVLLEESRTLARGNDAHGLFALSRRIADCILAEAGDLLRTAGASSETDLAEKKFYGLAASDISRRLILLSLACMKLGAELKDAYRAHHIVKAAKTLNALWREDMKLRATPTNVHIPGLRAVTVKGKLNHVKYYERPGKPFSSATIIGAGLHLIAPYKSLPRMGVTNGASVWATGTLKITPAGKRLFELEFEGLEPHAEVYWEDYLAYKYKDIFNLYPSALRMIYEYPDLRRTDAPSDLRSRRI